MRASTILSVIVALGAISSAGSAAEASAGAVSRLTEQMKTRKNIYVDRTGPEMIWSDGAMYEVTKSVPRGLEASLAPAKGGPDMRAILARFTPKAEQGWQEAKIVRSGRGQEPAVIESKDGKHTLDVASAYFDYLHERYPKARLWIKDRLTPVVFVVDGNVRAMVMGLAKPNSPPVPAKKA
jgi:hypothetical protein